jgi:tetratricopeptide (TPR) repeat protein
MIFIVKAVSVAVITLTCLACWKKWPWLPAMWGFFVLPILPSLHFMVNGANYICSHYVYLASVMPIIIGVLLTYKRLQGSSSHFYFRLLSVAVAAVLVVYVGLDRHYLNTWKNSETVWTRVISVDPVGRAYYYRSLYYSETGDYAKAAADLVESIRMGREAGHPELYTLYAMLGDVYRLQGLHDEAIEALSTAIALRPVANFYYYRALAYQAKGMTAEAEADFLLAGDDTGPIVWQFLKEKGGHFKKQ